MLANGKVFKTDKFPIIERLKTKHKPQRTVRPLDSFKLGFKVARTTIRYVLKRNQIIPAPVRNGSLGWRQLRAHYQVQIVASDFFTVETIWLKTLYILFFIELGTRRVYLAGTTAHPDQIWIN